MKTKTILACCLFMLAFTGCNVHSKLSCPDLSSRSAKHPMWARHQMFEKKAKATPSESAQVPKEKPVYTASADDKAFEIKLPKFASKGLTDTEIKATNDIFKSESNDKVQMVRRADNKVYVMAASHKALFNLTKALVAKKPAAAGYADDRGSRMALASGILGIVAFLGAFGPYVWFFSFAAAIAAIVLGVFGLRSARRGWAITGIVLGSVALFIALVFTGLFFGIGIFI